MSKNPTTTPSTPPANRRSQFGTRTVFVLIALAALAAWWARGEMLKEHRRDELLTAMGTQGNAIDIDINMASLRGRIGAALRNKRPTGKVAAARIVDVADTALLREFMTTFPDARLDLHLKADEASPRLLEFLSRSQSLNTLHMEGPVDSHDLTLFWLAQIRLQTPLNLEVERVDDDLLHRIVEVNLNIVGIRDAHPVDPLGLNSFWDAVTDEGLRSAAKLPELGTLFAGRQGSDAGLAAFENHAAIDHAELTGRGYTDASADVLATLPQLRVLSLVDTSMTDAGIAKTLASGKIHTLVIENAELGEASIAAIAKMTALAKLELRNVPLSPELAAAIVKRPLGFLMLYGCSNDDALGRSTQNAKGKDLANLFKNHPEGEWLGRQQLWMARADKPYLMYLNFVMSGAMGSGSSGQLFLGGPDINATFAAKLPRIEAGHVALFGSSIDDEGLIGLRPASSSLSIVGTRVTAKGLESLRTAGKRMWVEVSFPENESPTVTQLEIDEVQLRPGGELLGIRLKTMDPATFESWLPRPSQKSTEEAP